jgi:Arc/MetJ-type ribon-helix-helix transcriptional regulator
MAITLSAEVQEAIESRMKQRGYADANEVVLRALQSLDEHVFAYEDLDEETREAIEEGQRQIDQGLGIPWEEAEVRLRARFGKV